jgi:serine/threonine protein phosphatase PrpC
MSDLIQSVTERTHKVSIETSLEQMHAHQDQTYSGKFIDEETGESGDWAMVTDGHGTSMCINFLRSIPSDVMDRFIGSPVPANTLFDHINANVRLGERQCSGATMCLVKVYFDRIVCINVGDSQAAIYKNGELAFISVEHNCYNEREKERLRGLYSDICFIQSRTLELLTDSKMTYTESEYAKFSNNVMLATTQAIGHNGRTGIAPDVTTIHYEPGDVMQVVIGSDGFWDMVMKHNEDEMLSFATKSSNELLSLCMGRWLQEWEMQPDLNIDEVFKSRYQRDQCDDACVVKIDITYV